jgi:tubulin-specific chaperone A
LIKECAYYKNEVKENQEKLDEMILSGKDPYDIKKFREVLGESEMMVPDSTTRMLRSVEDLRNFVRECNEVDGGEDLRGSQWYEAAMQILDDQGAASRDPRDAHGEQQTQPRVETNISELAQGEIF